MRDKAGFPWKTVLIIVAIFTVLCIGLAAVVGGIVYFMSQSEEGLSENWQFDFNLGGEPGDEKEIPAGQPTIAPQLSVIASPVAASTVQPEEAESVGKKPEAAEPVVEEPSETNADLTGKQETTDLRIFDDFSSNSFEWYEKEDTSYSIKFENDFYNFHSKVKDYFIWAEFPVAFIPYEIAFDVKGPAGKQDGTFGVECHYLDDDNVYFIEFDLSTNKYTISETKDGKNIPLTKSSYGQNWLKSTALKSPPTSVNHIKISCYLESISLYINDKFVDQVDVMDPLPEPGIGKFYVKTLDNTDKDGYSVSFDNVEIYEPMQ